MFPGLILIGFLQLGTTTGIDSVYIIISLLFYFLYM